MSAQDEFDRCQVMSCALDSVIAVGMAEAADGHRDMAYGMYEIADKICGSLRQYEARVKVLDTEWKLTADAYALRKRSLSRLLGLFNAANNCGEGENG